MARTRHAEAVAEQNDEAVNKEEESVESGDEKTAPPVATASFKTSLARFQYANSQPDANAPATRTPPPKRTLKRPLTTTTTNTTPSPSPAKRRRPASHYAPPATYAHLPPLPDALAPNLIAVFIGTNPGIRTATSGHAYAHPSNSFWKLLHSSGCTDVRLPPSNDSDLPAWYALGNTNLVGRASRDAGELSKREMAEGTPALEAKVRRWRPEAVCVVGKGIWEAVFRWRYGREMRKGEFGWGWQDERMGAVEGVEAADEWEGARVYVTSSTSGLSASLKPAEKEAIWRPFGKWVKERRKARFGVEGRIDQRVGEGEDG
ncbi:hypothetical protein LTR08_006229 [Meristemomyces frigidus]|nr:hypothetical protein LTR08_006229 [Meristemomyces frigidus]